MRKLQAVTLTSLTSLALVAAACGDDSSGDDSAMDSGAQPAAPASTAASKPKPKGTKIQLKGSQFGKILYDAPRGQAIYLFDKETTRKPRCYGDCAKAWPPVYTKDAPRAGRGIDAKLLGTTKRSDGRRQVTYGGHPLYFYAHEGPGQVLCHDVEEFGGTWLVVRASGDAVPGSS